jgi:hypothetical protein
MNSTCCKVTPKLIKNLAHFITFSHTESLLTHIISSRIVEVEVGFLQMDSETSHYFLKELSTPT